MNIYIGNISFQATEQDIKAAFEAFGRVDTVNLIKDRFSGQPRGFGFVEMPVQAEAEAAINGLNGKEVAGRALTVNMARPKSEGGGGGGGHGGGHRDRGPRRY
jgi:RNA recognition motif-containing protein